MNLLGCARRARRWLRTSATMTVPVAELGAVILPDPHALHEAECGLQPLHRAHIR
jgi:hypothetical protein